MRHAVYSGTRNLYADMETACKSLVANSSVTDIWLMVEGDSPPFALPDCVRWHVMDMSGQTYISPNSPNWRSEFTYMAMIRAAYADILPEYVTRIVSLDCDTVCVDDVDYLWEVDMRGKCFAASEERLGSYKPYGARYWNVGVCVYDLAKIRAENVTQRLLELINGVKLWCVEQDAIASTHDVLTLPERYNESAVTSYTDDPAIVHFASFGTDWHNCDRAPRREYWKRYESMTWDEVVACRKC